MNIKTLLTKNSIVVKKFENKYYEFGFDVNNTNIYLNKIINFTLMDILYALNKDIFEDYKMIIHNEQNATVYFLYKHFLQDFGLTQKYVYFNINITEKDNMLSFNMRTIKDSIPDNLPEGVELLIFADILTECKFITPHNVHFESKLMITDKIELFEFIENFAIKISGKITLRIKQFIENYI